MMACAGKSASHCGILMIPCMLFFGSLLLLGLSLPFDLMPVLLPTFLGLFLGLNVYYYFRGYRGCSGCGEPVERKWRACPHCGSAHQTEPMVRLASNPTPRASKEKQ